MRIVVLGCGMIGSTIVADLSMDERFAVVAADRSEAALERARKAGAQAVEADLADPATIKRVLQDADVAVNAVPGHLGYRALTAILEAGVPAVDIAFMPEDFFTLDELARAKGVTAAVDFGVAPGLSNLLVGRAASLLDEAHRAEILVGGLPKRRVLPWEYTAPFSPVDVLEEYTRPARLVENGKVVERPALSEPELVELPHVGTLEAFNTDGLRTLIDTVSMPDMREKTLRYPGYVGKVQLLKDTGFFAAEPVLIGNTEVAPRDVTAALLFEAWKLPEGEPELTVMRVEVEGVRDGQATRYTYDLYDEYDPHTGLTSMARTTGFPAAAMARLLATGAFSTPGIVPPEVVGTDPDVYARLLADLEMRGVVIHETVRVG